MASTNTQGARPESLLVRLKRSIIPKDFQKEFSSHFALVDHIRKFETTEKQMLYYLAYELRNKNRGNIKLRLHMRYNKLRMERERGELNCQDIRY